MCLRARLRPTVESLLVETNQNLDEHLAMIAEPNALGVRYDSGQVARAERKKGTFEGVAEYASGR